MLSESLRVPYRADDAIGTILVGSVLTLLIGVGLIIWLGLVWISPLGGIAVTPIVVLPSLVMRGYLLQVVTRGYLTEGTVPSFIKWGTLVRTGSKSALLSVIYLLPAAVLCGLALGGGVATVVSPPGFEGTLQVVTGVVIMLSGFGLLLYLPFYVYVRPAAESVFAATGSLRTAVGLRDVLRLASTGRYLSGWLIAMGLLVVGPTVLLPLFVVAVVSGYISPVLAAVGVLGTVLLGIVFQFVFRVSAAWATGRGAADGLGLLGFAVPSTAVDTASTDTASADSASTDTASELISEPEPEPNPNPDTKPRAPEVDPDIQVGRTIQFIESTKTDHQSSTASTGTDGGQESIHTADTEPTDTDSEASPESTQEAPVDKETDESGFVWGVEDEP